MDIHKKKRDDNIDLFLRDRYCKFLNNLQLKPILICMPDNEGFVPVIEEKELKEGKMKLVRVEGTPVLFIKQKGKIYVIDDRCPHMGCGFSGGSLDGELVICPCHGWRFNLESGDYEDAPSYVLVKFPFKVESGKIWVKVQDDF